MHIKFLAHGTGSGARASAYLMGPHDHTGEPRAGVAVLRGDPVLFAAVADSLPFQQRYSSAVISWAAEEAPRPDEISSVLDDFEFVEHSRNVDTSGLIALGLRMGQSSFSATTLASRSTESSVRVADGFDGDELLPSYSYSIQWAERQFISQQFAGEHKLGDSLAKWQLTGSQAMLYAPDRREVRFDLRGGDGIYNLLVPALLRRFDELTDDNLDLSTDWEKPLGSGKLKVGAQAIVRERDSQSRSFGYQGGLGLDTNSPGRLVSDVVNPNTITGDTASGYAYLNGTLPSDSYVAELKQYSVYGSYEILLGEKFDINVGGRFEQYEQTTETFSLQGAQEAVRSLIDEGSFLPSLSLNWLISESQQLRLGLSRTVARPDFKETSNATFYDNDFDFRVRGNPLLKPSQVTNFDLRFEHYGTGGQNSSVALFYKDMTDPIERVVQVASGTAGNSRTYQNATKAQIYGVEVEGRRDIPLGQDLSRAFFVALNASLIKSEVELLSGGKRELQGQPQYTANLIVGFDHIPSGQEVTLLLNQNGKSIQDVGISDLPDVIQEPRLNLNLNYRWRLAKGLEFKAKVNNLLNSDVKFTQGGQVFQSYRRGTEIEAGIDWSF
jgi:TonB-dependent receptor